jgi:ferredoxin
LTFHVSNVKRQTWNLGRVIVVGGGNVAIDSAMTARRLGAREVTILYRRSRAEMPANPWEIAEAETEGIQFHYLAAPVRVVGQGGRVVALECLRMELGAPDASGRRRPLPISGSEFTLPCDTVITAVGQMVACGFAGLATAAGGTFLTDPVTLQTSLPGVFVGGDAISGPASVVEAIAAGRRAADSIVRYLRGEDLALGRTAARPDTLAITYYTPAEPVRQPRAEMPHLPVSERIGFAEIALGFSPEAAVAEAQRCLSCGVCSECLACVRVCQPHAIQHDQAPVSLLLDVGAVLWADGRQAAPLVDGIYVLPGDLRVAPIMTAQVVADLSANQRISESARAVRTRTTHHATRFPFPASRFTLHAARIGVFVCRCGDEIDSILDVDALAEMTRVLPGVAYAQALPFSCQPETLAAIQEAVSSHGLNRVLLAACSCCALDQVCYSCTYQRVRCKGNLGEIGESANQRISETQATSSLVTRHSFPALGLPVEFVNIREQCAWVHEDAPELATDKARRLIAATVERGRRTKDEGQTAARVDAYRCRACGTCETVCEVSAVKVVEADGRRMAQVDVLRCTGCGTCAAHCPSSAITAGDPTDRQIANMLQALLAPFQYLIPHTS